MALGDVYIHLSKHAMSNQVSQGQCSKGLVGRGKKNTHTQVDNGSFVQQRVIFV